MLTLGASPRATLGLLAAGRALALLRGRRFLVPQDIHDVAPEVLRHRLILLATTRWPTGVTSDDVIGRLLTPCPAPRVAPQQDDAPCRRPAPAYPVERVGMSRASAAA